MNKLLLSALLIGAALNGSVMATVTPAPRVAGGDVAGRSELLAPTVTPAARSETFGNTVNRSETFGNIAAE